MVIRNPRTNFYDFQKITLEDLQLEQDSAGLGTSLSNQTIAGNGVLLDFPSQPVLFDSDHLSAAQSGYDAVDTFDGRGVLATPVPLSDLSEGVQIAVQVSGARLEGSKQLIATLIGKIFDGSLVYEHLVFDSNQTLVSRNHYRELTNVMFQNMLGNNTAVDGYTSFDTVSQATQYRHLFTRGRVVVSEAASYQVSADLISAEWIRKPDLIFRDYRTYAPGKLLSQVIKEAIGPSNNIDELDINTTTASQRTFDAGASTELIYAQKFRMIGTNIQKISLAIGLQSGEDWSGSLTVGIVPLLTTTSCQTQFLPDNLIEFDPDVIPIEEVSLNRSQMEQNGFVLGPKTRQIDFVFSSAQVSNPTLSRLEDGGYYAITIRRTGSTSVGTLFFDEAINNDSLARRLSVFSSQVWTDIETSTFWHRIWSDSVQVAAGVAFDQGVRLPILKTGIDNNATRIQNLVENLALADTGEGAKNYLLVQKDLAYSEPQTHPRTGDLVDTVREDVPKFTFVSQDELKTILIDQPSAVVLARVRDLNPRANPVISGTLKYAGLALGNIIDIVEPGSDLLTQSVIGSLIVPNINKPQFQYRITGQQLFSDQVGDLNLDGQIDIFDAERMVELDGYQLYLATTTHYTSGQQRENLISRSTSMLELLRSELDSSDGYEITSQDLLALNNFINQGTAFPNNASTITRVRLTVEPVIRGPESYDRNGLSILRVENTDPDLVDPSQFTLTTGIDYAISFQPTWYPDQVEILDMRRFVLSSFSDFSAADLATDPETGGKNSLFVPGDLYLSGQVLERNGQVHPLDFEANVVELELPAGNTEGEFNFFQTYVQDRMLFSDGTAVSAQALNLNQVKFHVAVSSLVKNTGSLPDGYGDQLDYDGYSDGYGSNADEAVGTYLMPQTGLMRIRAFNIVRNEFFPELRTRITISVGLKKAGFANQTQYVDSQSLAGKLRVFAP